MIFYSGTKRRTLSSFISSILQTLRKKPRPEDEDSIFLYETSERSRMATAFHLYGNLICGHIINYAKVDLGKLRVILPGED